MKILIVPDSFKGSLTSKEVCDCIRKGILECTNEHDITALPFADGGESFAESMHNICNGEILYTKAHNIYGRTIQAAYLACGDTAVIECAQASGLLKKKDVMNASSFGTGEVIKAATEQGFRNIILGLGGSGCCDGGAGALTALGAIFYDINYEKITQPCGRDLNDIYGISLRNIVKDINFIFACDVTNPYFGKQGAAYVFAPQKGAREKDLPLLDEGLKRLNAFLPTDIGQIPGAGAAGGLCGGLYSVYGGTICSGFDVLANYAKLEDRIRDCDLVITGEGKTDRQTLMGKLPCRVAALAKKYHKHCVVISGTIEGVSLGYRMISLTDGNTTTEYAMKHAASLLKEKAKYILQ